MALSIITYNATSAQMNYLLNVDELSRYHDNVQSGAQAAWINVRGLQVVNCIKTLGKRYNIHPLSIEDILSTEQQPKIEIFDDYRFLSIKTIKRAKSFHHDKKKRKQQSDEVDEFLIDQISMIIMQNVIITFQEMSDDSFDRIRKKILDGAGEIRKKGTAYLAYAIIDAVVDEYYLTLNHLEDDIENFEDRATKTNDDNFVEEIQDTKKYLLQIRRAILPLKDNMLFISHHTDFFQTDDLKPFLHDLNENLNNAIVTVEHYYEWLSDIMNVNLSVLSHQMNKVMKVLATISTIFIPLTFIGGVYGMNFQHMPELSYELGYPIVLGGMGLVAISMIIFFKIRRWF
jgi:magnesium transporter